VYRTNRKGETKTIATEEDRCSRNFIPLLNRLLVNQLSSHNEDLQTTEVDVAPRLEAFWSLGGIEPDKTLKKVRGKNELFFKGKVDDPIDRYRNYEDYLKLYQHNFNGFFNIDF
jgi:hypothetical protein